MESGDFACAGSELQLLVQQAGISDRHCESIPSSSTSCPAGTINHENRAIFSYRIVRFGLWDSVGLQATFEMVNSCLHFGQEAILPTGYISSIACLPASRGRGYGGAGLKYLLEHMRDAGQVLSTTMAER